MNIIIKVFGFLFLIMGLIGFYGITIGEKEFSEWFGISAFLLVLGLLGVFKKK